LAQALQAVGGKRKNGAHQDMKHQRKPAQGGFTLPELLIVVAIIGVLAALLMPTIRGYTIRAKVSEAMLMINQCRNQVSEVYASGADIPVPDAWGCEADKPSRYVDSLNTKDDGIIVVTLGNEIGDLRLSLHKITLAPLNGAGNLMSDADLGTPIRRWRCGSATDGTDLKAEYLPSTCRG
jgi:type IV pilus assembly protein PilA